MSTVLRKANRWLLPSVLILFILEVVTFPFVLGITFADRSETPDLQLNYTPGYLYWDSSSHINPETGAAEMDFFYTEGAVRNEDGTYTIAPGMGGGSIIRMQNRASGHVEYTAVMYELHTNENAGKKIPINSKLHAENSEKLDLDELDEDLYLPKDIKDEVQIEKEHIVGAVGGRINAGQIQDFDLSWMWDYYDTTVTGDTDDLVTVGFYIIVEDFNEYPDDDDDDEGGKRKPNPNGEGIIVYPQCPDTSDNSNVEMYLALMGISALLLILLYADRRREQRKQE